VIWRMDPWILASVLFSYVGACVWALAAMNAGSTIRAAAHASLQQAGRNMLALGFGGKLGGDEDGAAERFRRGGGPLFKAGMAFALAMASQARTVCCRTR